MPVVVLHVLVVVVNGNDIFSGCNWNSISGKEHFLFNRSTWKSKEWVGRAKGRRQNILNRWWIKRRDQKWFGENIMVCREYDGCGYRWVFQMGLCWILGSSLPSWIGIIHLREWDWKENTNFDGDNTFTEACCYLINILVECHALWTFSSIGEGVFNMISASVPKLDCCIFSSTDDDRWID